MLQDRNSDCNTAMIWAPEGKKRRGRPKTTWSRTVEKEEKKEGRMGIMERRPVRSIAAN